MRVKVELQDDVYSYLRHDCTLDEVLDFTEKLQAVRESPIHRSEPHFDPAVSRFALRRFTFGAGAQKIAIFLWDAAEPRIVVVECRMSRQRPKRNDAGDPGGAENGN